jgi:hypothetical protein
MDKTRKKLHVQRFQHAFVILALFALGMQQANFADAPLETRAISNHVLHVITLPAKDYEITFCKARDQVIGRETVASMAERNGADVAINAGFFEIGPTQDGIPIGTLIIKGKIFGLRCRPHTCIVEQAGKLEIKTIDVLISAQIDGKTTRIGTVNRFADKNDLVLYTDAWGPRTLTNFKNRREIAFDHNRRVLKTYDHGNSPIPPNGFVLSLRSSPTDNQPLKTLKVDSLTISILGIDAIEDVSAVMGLPQLVAHGAICPDLETHKRSFYTKPHARTALGIKANGDIIIVVAEHAYKKSLKELNLGEVKTVITNNAVNLMLRYKKVPWMLTIEELKEFVEEELSVKNGAAGLTIPELARVMLDLGCDSAITLDSGGSSTLWRDGKMANQAIDENGQIMVRPVSDAIIFKKRPTPASSQNKAVA